MKNVPKITGNTKERLHKDSISSVSLWIPHFFQNNGCFRNLKKTCFFKSVIYFSRKSRKSSGCTNQYTLIVFIWYQISEAVARRCSEQFCNIHKEATWYGLLLVKSTFFRTPFCVKDDSWHLKKSLKLNQFFHGIKLAVDSIEGGMIHSPLNSGFGRFADMKLCRSIR